MKKFALKAAVIAIAGYLGVVGYIHQYDKGQSEKLLAEGNYSAEQQKVAKILFDNGCQYCHTSNADLPFYANLPFADSVLSHDIESGKRVFLLNKLLDGLKDPSKLSEVDLAKLERVIENNEMPVAKFRHIHWGSRPDDSEKTTLLNWIREQRKAFLPANTQGANPHNLIQPIPDAVIIIGSSGNKAQAAIEKIKSDPSWQSISAVKNNRVYANPTGTFSWDRYSAEEALQILWAAQLFHPEKFKDVDMVEKTQTFYKKYYHYELSKENAQQILKGLLPLK